MKVGYFLMAEGIAQDADGAFSVIRLNQNIVHSAELPVVTKRALVLNLEDEGEATEGQSLTVSMQVKSPTGAVISAQSQQVTLGAKRYKDLPGAIFVPAEVVLSLPEYGEYEVIASVTGLDGPPVEGHLALWCMSGLDPTTP